MPEVRIPVGTPQEVTAALLQEIEQLKRAAVHPNEDDHPAGDGWDEDERIQHARKLTEHQYWQMVADAAFAKQIRKCVTDANRAMTDG